MNKRFPYQPARCHNVPQNFIENVSRKGIKLPLWYSDVVHFLKSFCKVIGSDIRLTATKHANIYVLTSCRCKFVLYKNNNYYSLLNISLQNFKSKSNLRMQSNNEKNSPSAKILPLIGLQIFSYIRQMLGPINFEMMLGVIIYTRNYCLVFHSSALVEH